MKTPSIKMELESAKSSFEKLLKSPYTMDEFVSAKAVLLSLERKVAAKNKVEYAETIDFPVRWDSGSPRPHLLSNGNHTFLLFCLPDLSSEENQEESQTESIALVEFHHCASVKLGGPNDEVLNGHPLYGKGLDLYAAQIVHNSRWIKELQRINMVHPRYNPESWNSKNHYVFWFHDETFECIAESFSVTVFQTSLDAVLLETIKRMQS